MQLDFESDFEVEGLQTDDEWSVDGKINSEMQDPDTDQPRELVTPVDSQDSRGEYASNVHVPSSPLLLVPSPPTINLETCQIAQLRKARPFL